MAGSNPYAMTTAHPTYTPRGAGGGEIPVELSSRPQPAGASPGAGTNWMGYAGLASMLGGSLMDYYGQLQGAKALEAESERQAAEQEAFSRERHAAMLASLGQFDPGAHPAMASGALLRSQRSVNPALAAGGKALGVRPDAISQVGGAMLPQQRVGAMQAADAGVGQQAHNRMRDLGIAVEDVDNRSGMASALYPMQSQIASQRGAQWRMGGQMLGGVGMPMIANAMAQPR